MDKETKIKEKKVKSDKNDFVLEIRNGFKLVDDRYNKLSSEMKNGFKLVDEKINSLSVQVDEKIGKLSIQVDEKIDDLAIATKKGFDKTATKEDAEYLKQRFNEADSRSDSIDDRLDGVETSLIGNHRHRIEKLEIGMTELREVLSLNK